MKLDLTQLAAGMLLLLSAPSPARCQVVLHQASGEEANQALGWSVAAAGDVDLDGVPDVLVGSSPHDSSHFGVVQLFSGRTGAVLRTWSSTHADEQFGFAVDSPGDLDQDGVPDVVIGAPNRYSPQGFPSGAIYAYSGATGAQLWYFSPGNFGMDHGAGVSIDGVGDLDGDGTSEVVIGSYRIVTPDLIWSSARVLSGRTGTVINKLIMPPAQGFGRFVAGPGDVDGDGWPDVLVGAPDADLGGEDAGAAYVISGHDWSVLRILRSPSGASRFGTVARAGDVDGDGRPDLLVGAPRDAGNGHWSGAVRLYSGADASLLRTLHGEPEDRFGSHLDGGRDVDGDGRPDVVVGAEGAQYPGPGAGCVRVCSLTDGRLLAEARGWETGEGLGPVAMLGDLNGDGASDIVAGAPGASASSALSDTGSVRVFLVGFPPPTQYCFPTFNSFDCGSSQLFQGVPSLSIGEPFAVTAPFILNRQPGFVVWGRAAANIPFGSGVLCVRPRFHGPWQDSGGTLLPGVDCSGVLYFRFTPATLTAHGFGPGDEVHCQFLSRDPHLLPPANLILSDAVVFTVVP